MIISYCGYCGKKVENEYPSRIKKYCCRSCAINAQHMLRNITLKSGQRFGRLIVLEYHERKNKRDYYLCKCDCGNKKVAEKNSLLSGNTKSCGCLGKETRVKNRQSTIKHGLYKKRIYRIWAGMKTRCLNEKYQGFNRYGGRGIKICEEWKNDFMSFYNWAMKNGYDDNLTIERVNNDGNYEPSNCIWATVKEQSRNRSTNSFIAIDGEIKTIEEWSEVSGVKRSTIENRYRRGWTGKNLIEEPWSR